jgi:hypothetical protein
MMMVPPIQTVPTGTDMPPLTDAWVPHFLYITLGPAGEFKAGTCQHCVIEEHERPLRAWDADGDSALDFDRDRLFAYLSELGVTFSNRQAYVCP